MSTALVFFLVCTGWALMAAAWLVVMYLKAILEQLRLIADDTASLRRPRV